MRTIDQYLDLAKSRNALPSDLKLSAMIGGTGAVVCNYRKKKTLPSDENMVRLAELAGIDPEEALLELSIWRAASLNAPAASAIYRRLLQRITHTAAALAITFVAVPVIGSPSPGEASHNQLNTNNISVTLEGTPQSPQFILWKIFGRHLRRLGRFFRLLAVPSLALAASACASDFGTTEAQNSAYLKGMEQWCRSMPRTVESCAPHRIFVAR